MNWRRKFAIVGKALANVVYPPRCVWCHTDLNDGSNDDANPVDGNLANSHLALCADCSVRLAPPVVGWCLRCGAPQEGILCDMDSCVHCTGEKFPWERVVALGPYRGDLSRAIVRTKTPRNEPLTFNLGRLLFQNRAAALRQLNTEVIIPMPSHWLRRLRRGVNGPDLLADALAAELRLPLKASVLKRSRLTPMQVDVAPSQRHVHQRKSFQVRARHKIQGRRILLVDDVLTTGATAVDAARALLSAGAAAVNVAVIARGIGDDAL